MSRASLDKNPRDVASMFDGVARRYDLTNAVLSLGQDHRWRKRTTESLQLQPGQRVLDLAAGTGVSTAELARTGATAIACDFSIGMSGVEDRPELRERHAVSIPYFEFREVLAVRFADSARYRTLKDLSGRRVATLGGTGAYQTLLDLQPHDGPIPISYDDDVHPYEDLVSGRVEAVLLDNIIAERSLRRTGGFYIQPVPVATGPITETCRNVSRAYGLVRWTSTRSRPAAVTCDAASRNAYE